MRTFFRKNVGEIDKKTGSWYNAKQLWQICHCTLPVLGDCYCKLVAKVFMLLALHLTRVRGLLPLDVVMFMISPSIAPYPC